MYGFGIYGDFLYGGGPASFGDLPAAPNGMVLRIGGKLRTREIKEGSLSISATDGSKPTMKLTLVDDDNSITVLAGQRAVLYSLGECLFAGVVSRPREKFPADNKAIVAKFIYLKCVSWHYLTTKLHVTAHYPRQLAGAIVRDLASRYLAVEGVTWSGVSDGITIGPLNFSDRQLAKVLDSIAKLIGYQWRITHDKDLEFFARETFAAPFNITDASRKYRTLEVERGLAGYRNIQIVRGGRDVGATQIERFKGNGVTQSFDVGFPVAEVQGIYVASEEQTIGIRGIEDEDADGAAGWYWKKNETSITQNKNDTPVADEQEIRVEYKPLVDIGFMSQEPAQIAARAAVEGGSGKYESVLTKKEIEDDELGSDIAESELRKHARVNTEIKVTTDEISLWPGQLQTVTLTNENVSGEFLIESVSIREIVPGYFRTVYTAIDNEAPGGWPEFFKRLADAGADFSIQAGQIVNPIGQVGTNILALHTENTQTGDHIEDKDDDPYTVGLMDGCPIGCRIEDEETGQGWCSGGVIGEFE